MTTSELIGARFELTRRAASGGMGVVFQGIDHREDRDVAVKILSSEAVADPRRFHREAKILAQLSHPGIVPYVAHGTLDSGNFYLVEAWIQGTTLAEFLETEGLTGRESILLARRVAEALAHLHARRIIHRDIKPSNLLLRRGKTELGVVLVDFGIARQQGRSNRLTATGDLVGTVGYMAPEQARGDGDIDVQADVFALGCVLYECLTGRPAFLGSTRGTVRTKVVLVRPTPLREFCPGMPEALYALVDRMLAKQPENRPRAREVAAQLASLPGSPDTARKSTRETLGPTRVLTAEDGSTAASDDVVCMVWFPGRLSGGPTLDARVIRRALTGCRGRVERIGNDGVLVILDSMIDGPGQAAEAATVARALARAASWDTIAIATARRSELSRGGLGRAIERSADIAEAAAMKRARSGRRFAMGNDGMGGFPNIFTDSATAELLAGRYRLARKKWGWRLVSPIELTTTLPPLTR